MTSMKDCTSGEVTGDADAVASKLYVENTIENPAWCTVEDNHVSFVSENVEKSIKLEINVLDDCMWESRIEIIKDVANQSYMDLPSECQDVTDNIYLNHGNTNDKIFHCNICGKSFDLNHLLKNHLAKHKRQVNYKTNKCIFCGKQFRLKFGLNRHIQNHHNSIYKCKFCSLFIDRSNYIEHQTYHERKNQTKSDKTFAIREYNETEVVNDSSFNTNGKQFVSRDITEINSSDHTRLVNSNSTIVSTVPQNSMPNNYIIPNPRQNNILERNSSDQICLVQSNATIVSTAPHTYIPNNDIISYPDQPKILSNTLENNNSDQIEQELVWSELFPEPVPLNVVRNKIWNIKQEHFFQTTVRDHFQKKINLQQSSVSIAPHNAIVNYNSPVLNIKQEINFRETNSSDRVNLANSNESIVSTTSQNSMENILSIKQEKNFCTNVRERNSSDQGDSVSSNESTLANEPSDLMAKQNPISIANNNIVSTVRETPYFCIRKLPNIKNKFRSDDYDQKSQNNFIFICRICENSPSIDIHSFALHMSDHRECNMHECIVCDETFNSVVLWTEHMIYHQQQIDLNVSIVIQNSASIEDNAASETMSRKQQNNNKSSSIKKANFCNLCNRKFTKRCYFTNHMKMKHNINTNIPKQLTSIDCNKSFILSKNIDENLKSKQHTNNLISNITKLKIKSISHKDKMNCRYCKKEYNSISQWKKHMSMSKECRRHCRSNLPEFTSNKTKKNSSKSGRFRCNICMKTYSTSYNRTKHIKNIHHILDKTYLNTYNNTGLQKDKLMDIIQQKPAIKKRNKSNHINGTKCEICGKIYYNRGNLSRHISVVHAQNYEPMTCNVSGISVNKKNFMKYVCKICKMKFADNITLQKHTKIHTLNMYKCNDCGQQYETTLSLSNHIWENHSGNISTSNKNDNVENYETQNASLEIINHNFVQCEICLKILKTPKYLSKHMRLHTGVKPFKCDKCNMAFRFKPNLKVHQKKCLAYCYMP